MRQHLLPARLVKVLANVLRLGWLALCHSTATGQWFAAQRTWTPAARALVLHPQRPANRSIAVVMGIPEQTGLWDSRKFLLSGKSMKLEKTQTESPHRLTVDQHVFPKSGIRRFCNPEGAVQVFSRKLGKALHLAPGNPFFLRERVRDQSAETGIAKQTEDCFGSLVDGILSGTVKTIGVLEKRVVEEFFSLWRTRQ